MLNGLVVDEKILVKELLAQNVDKKMSENIIRDFFKYKLVGIPIKYWFTALLITALIYRLKK